MQESNLEFALKSAIEYFVKEELKTGRKDIFNQLHEIYQAVGSKSFVIKLPDGEKVATFTINEPSPVEEVDEEQFITWLEENGYDDQVLTRHIPEQVIPARTEKAIKTGVLGAIGATLTKDGQYVTPHGEIVEGIEEKPAPEPSSFTVRFEGNKEGRRKIIQAWQNGELNHIVAGTTLPQIEA